MERSVTLLVNGARHELGVDADATLLDVLRGRLGLNGPKYGCGLGECGACAVLIDGKAARACSIRAHTVAERAVVTLEGLAGDGALDPVQAAFVSAQAAQCGYCLNGMVMTIRALLNAGPVPDRDTIRAALKFNLCRCGTHVEILRAACIAAGLDSPELASIA